MLPGQAGDEADQGAVDLFCGAAGGEERREIGGQFGEAAGFALLKEFRDTV